jgi:hypothetical protein
MVLLIIVPLAIFNKYQAEAQEAWQVAARFSAAFNRWFGRGWLSLGYLFLYLPIVALVVFSFNDSPLPNVWRGFTLKWYARCRRPRDAGRPVAEPEDRLLTACGSVVLGTLAAFALVKYRRFTGRTLFSGMVSAPLVMPEVVVGLSLLLMLVSVQRAIGFPERGMLTIWLGHLLLGMAYATVVVQARLQDLNPQLEKRRWTWAPGPAGVLAGHAADDRAEPGLGLAAHLHHLARRRGAVGLPVRPRRHHHAAGDLLARAAGAEPQRQRRGHADHL